MDLGFHTYYIKGKRASRAEIIGLIMSCGGWVPTLASTEPDRLSKTICSDGKSIRIDGV